MLLKLDREHGTYTQSIKATIKHMVWERQLEVTNLRGEAYPAYYQIKKGSTVKLISELTILDKAMGVTCYGTASYGARLDAGSLTVQASGLYDGLTSAPLSRLLLTMNCSDGHSGAEEVDIPLVTLTMFGKLEAGVMQLEFPFAPLAGFPEMSLGGSWRFAPRY
jgi:hypothetical protein